MSHEEPNEASGMTDGQSNRMTKEHGFSSQTGDVGSPTRGEDSGTSEPSPTGTRITKIGRYNVPDLRDLFADYHGDYRPEEDEFAMPVGRELL